MKKLLILTSLSLATLTSHASTSVYTDEATFVANAGPLAFDSFEDLDAAYLAPVPSLDRPGYVLGTSLADDSYGLYVFDFPSWFGTFATHGDTYVVNQTDDGQRLRFDFAAPVYDFGVTITDWENPAMTAGAGLLFGNDAGDSVLITATPMLAGDTLFFGVVNAATPFTWVEILNTASAEAYGIDGVYFTRPVPAPAALWLFGSALIAGLAPVRARRPGAGG